MERAYDRDYFTDGLEIRESQGGVPRLVGYAAVFNQETVIRMGPHDEWRERIAPTAFDQAVGRDDIIAAVNHDHTKLLGRTKSGTLSLVIDGHGLRYEVLLPNTQLGADVREQVRRGDLQGSSFKFAVPDGGARIVKEAKPHPSNLPLVEIENVRLVDVGPVTFPAYAGTSVSARSVPTGLAEFVQNVKREAEKAIRERIRLQVEIARAKAWP